MDRGTGITTRQIQEAPQGAFFVWPVASSIKYAYDLAHQQGRDDLTVIPFKYDLRLVTECDYGHIVLDHACKDHYDGWFGQQDKWEETLEWVYHRNSLMDTLIKNHHF